MSLILKRTVIIVILAFSYYIFVHNFSLSYAVTKNVTAITNKTRADALRNNTSLSNAAANNVTLIIKNAAGNATKNALTNLTGIAKNAAGNATKNALGNLTGIAKNAAGNATKNALGNNTSANATAKIVRSLLGENPSGTAMTILGIIGLVIAIPVGIDLILAHIRRQRETAQGTASALVGMPGLYRALMTFGVILIVGTLVFYAIGLVIANISMIGPPGVQALIDVLRNLASILGTALASVIAFYFGTRGAEKAAEKAMAKEGIVSVDSVPPEVISMSPANGSSGVQINSPIITTFSEPIRPSTITANSFTVKYDNITLPGIITVSEDKRTITFTPLPSLQSNKQHTVTVTTGVMDLADNGMKSDKIWSFHTI
jgi:Bacterial Ig-like domain